MKFKPGDNTDLQLCEAITHEFLRCESALREFNFHLAQLKATDNRVFIAYGAYDSYSRFIQSLYEFFLGCQQRDAFDTKAEDKVLPARYIKMQLDKILDNINAGSQHYRLSKSDVASISQDVLENFPDDFRIFRNKISAHVSHKRAELDLFDFYRKYNKLLVALFSSCEWWWGQSNQELPSLKYITLFAEGFSMNRDP